MTEAGRRWVDLFEKEGWFRYGQLDRNGDLDGVGISYLGGDKTIMGLGDIAQVTDEFLVFEYRYEIAPEGGAGRAKLWIPWENIQYIFQTKAQAEPEKTPT